MSLLTTITRVTGYPSLDLVSPLTRAECVRRLREKTEGWQFQWAIFIQGITVVSGPTFAVRKPVTGHVGDHDLRFCKGIDGFNSFQTNVFAELVDQGSMTRLQCRIGVHPFVVAFMAFWFAAVMWLGAGYLLEPDGVPLDVNLFGLFVRTYHGYWVAITMPLCFIAFGIGLVMWCRYMVRDEEKFLIDFLHDTVEAQKV